MKNSLLCLFLFVIATPALSQNFKEEFYTKLSEGDTTAQLQILKNWEASNREDAELYPAWFNYYFRNGQEEIVTVSTDIPEGESMILVDSLGNTTGYMYTEVLYDEDMLNKGMDKIDEGIALYPNRLDMRFGKIYVMEQLGSWDAFTAEIIKTIQYSTKNKNKWTWTDNEKKKDGEAFFLSSLQDYQYDIWNAGDDELLIFMRQIAMEIVKYYPDHLESWANIGSTFLVAGEYKKAEEAFLKAEKINPKDVIVLNNLAICYEYQSNNIKAIEYYERMIEYGDEGDKKFAENRIRELKN